MISGRRPIPSLVVGDVHGFQSGDVHRLEISENHLAKSPFRSIRVFHSSQGEGLKKTVRVSPKDEIINILAVDIDDYYKDDI